MFDILCVILSHNLVFFEGLSISAGDVNAMHV